MRRAALSLALAIATTAAALLGAGCDTENTPVGEWVAVRKARIWLSWVDTDSLETAYEDAAQELRDRRSRERWIADVRRAREAFGEVVDRRLDTKRYDSQPEGYAPGTYVVLSFTTDFEREKNVEELMVLEMVDDVWRVARYIIDPSP